MSLTGMTTVTRLPTAPAGRRPPIDSSRLGVSASDYSCSPTAGTTSTGRFAW
jgi:hypothetical protein